MHPGIIVGPVVSFLVGEVIGWMIYLDIGKDGRRIMACASIGRSYKGKKGDGYGIYDFKFPSKASKSTFVGYGTIPGIP